MGRQDVQPNNDTHSSNNPNDTDDANQGHTPGFSLDTSRFNTPSAQNSTNRPLQTPIRETTDAQRDATADIARGQISSIYERDSPYKGFEEETSSPAQSSAEHNNPYDRTHAPESQLSPTEHFRRYHTAWQDYYQKYYESYYTQAVRQTQEQLRLKSEMQQSSQSAAVFGTPARSASDVSESDTPASATRKLQSQFKKKIGERARKVRHSKHFWPLITAVGVAIVFLFLQYNSLLIANVAAFVSPGSVDPENIIVDPTTDTKVGPDPKLIIPKINVDAPVNYTTSYTNDAVEAALKNGVVKYAITGANANPGQVGNLVIGGHSSNDVFDDGNYKFVFVQLEKLVVGDTMYLNYQGTRYTYHVTKTQTIEPNQIGVLTTPVSTPTVTLVTCTPVGTALHRFLVTAEQVSPDPSTAAASTDSSSSSGNTIPGNSPTLLEQIFGQ